MAGADYMDCDVCGQPKAIYDGDRGLRDFNDEGSGWVRVVCDDCRNKGWDLAPAYFVNLDEKEGEEAVFGDNEGLQFFVCDCTEHAIAVESEKDEPTINIAIWHCGVEEEKASWRERLRHIWRIIRHGHPYADCVVLKEDEIRKLRNRLSYEADRVNQVVRGGK